MAKRQRCQNVLGVVLATVLAMQVLLAGKSAYAASDADGGPAYQSIQDVPSDPAVDALAEGKDYEPGRVIVGFKGSVSDASAQQTLDDAVTVDTGALPALSAASDGQGSDLGDQTAIVPLEHGATVSQAVTELSQDPDVAFVQPNFIYTVAEGAEVGSGEAESPGQSATDGQGGSLPASSVVDDPDSDSSQEHQWYLDAIRARQAWNVAKGSDSNVSVAVIDTGCDVSHPDLSANIRATHNASDSWSNDVSDMVGHGTGVCGVISAVANNGTGIAGVSYNAGLVVIKADVDNSVNFTSETIVRALEYAVSSRDTYNIRVINMSIAAPSSQLTPSGDEALEDAVGRAHGAGMLVVCAAGNSGGGATVPYAASPGDYPDSLSVMNVNNNQTLSNTSNYNESGSTAKNLCAPGSGIYTCGSSRHSRSPYDYPYQTLSGTSFAAPMVSAVAALCFTAGPSLGVDACTSILEQTATDLGDAGWDPKYGYGEVNALAAVQRAKSEASSSSSSGGPSNQPSSSGSASTGKTDTKVATIPIMRLYNPYSGEHLFTTDRGEYAYLATLGWRQEGTAWHAAASSSQPIMRLYNPYSGEHFYTASLAEYASLATIGWRQEGTAFYASDQGGTSVFRLFNPYVTVGTHLYTTSETEYESLGRVGWSQEGTAWYAMAG